MAVEKIVVVGAGTMGSSLAYLLMRETTASVVLHDISEKMLERATLFSEKELAKLAKKHSVDVKKLETMKSRLSTTTELGDLCCADIAITAVTEDLETKQTVFRDLGHCVSPDAILATCTSALSVTAIASATEENQRVIGLHFFYPAHIIKLVEVVRGMETSDEVFERAKEFCIGLGKEVIATEDSPGFATTRLVAVYINEAIFALHEGLASAEDIDRGMKLGYNMPIGPLAFADRIGLDVLLSEMETLYRDYGDPKYRPCILLRKKVESGQLGRKTGDGFFEYG